jgi:hypothetical protein
MTELVMSLNKLNLGCQLYKGFEILFIVSF